MFLRTAQEGPDLWNGIEVASHPQDQYCSQLNNTRMSNPRNISRYLIENWDISTKSGANTYAEMRKSLETSSHAYEGLFYSQSFNHLNLSKCNAILLGSFRLYRK